MLYHAGRQIKTLRREGRQLALALHQGRQIYPGKAWRTWRIQPLACAVVEDAGEKWFEVSFKTGFPLTGSAADGWTDPAGQYGIRLERSENLQTWDHEFVAAPGYPIDHGDGTWTNAARCRFPIDSAIKTGAIVAAVNGWQDVRNQPFTALEIAGEAQALQRFPYQMPGHAADLQTDLRAAGWTGAVVTSTAWNVWSIAIPNVSSSAYGHNSKIFWPAYTITDPFGNLQTIDGMVFGGSFVNAAGVRTNVPKQFCRLAITHLSPP